MQLSGGPSENMWRRASSLKPGARVGLQSQGQNAKPGGKATQVEARAWGSVQSDQKRYSV